MFSFFKNKHPYLLNQYKVHLNALIDRALVQSEVNDSQIDTLNSLKSTLKEAIQWQRVYDIELQVIEYLDEDELQNCWSRKQADREILTPNLQEFYKQQSEQNLVGTKLKSMLAKLVCDLQWRYEIKRLKSVFSARTRLLIALMFLFSFVLFFTPTISKTFFNHELFNDSIRMYYLFTAATAGILGASFSQLTSMRSNISKASIDQIRTMSNFSYVMARSTIGAGAGLIMFYIIQSGFVNLIIFPEFIKDQQSLLSMLLAEQQNFEAFKDANGTLPQVIDEATTNAQAMAGQVNPDVVTSTVRDATAEDLLATAHAHETKLQVGGLKNPSPGISLLIVWCFIAGFSEKLIPGILSKGEQQALQDEKA